MVAGGNELYKKDAGTVIRGIFHAALVCNLWERPCGTFAGRFHAEHGHDHRVWICPCSHDVQDGEYLRQYI